MTGDEREAIRQTLVVVDYIQQRASKRLEKAKKLIEEIEELLENIPKRKETLYTLLKMQEKKDEE